MQPSITHASAKRRLGRAAIDVSVLAVGTGAYANMYAAVSDADCKAATDAALAAGLNLFDTAPAYGSGLAEHRAGETLRGTPRDRFLVCTKVGRILRPTRGQPQAYAGFLSPLPFDVIDDYTFDGAMRSIEDSLQRLGLGFIDIVLIHDIHRRARTQESMEHYREAMSGAYVALERLRAERVIAAIGVGISDPAILTQCARDGDFDCFMLAGRYTLLEQSGLDTLLPECERRDIAVLLASPYNSGVLASGAQAGSTYFHSETPPPIVERVRRLEAICAEYRIPLGAAALQFPLAHRAVASVVPSYRNAAEVSAAVANIEHDIPGAFWQRLREDGLIRADAPVPGEGRS